MSEVPMYFGAGTANSLPCALRLATLFPNERRDFCVVFFYAKIPLSYFFWGGGGFLR